MKIKQTALEILDKAVNKVFWLCRFQRPGKPGEVIDSLSSEEREALTKLTSDEAKNMQVPGAAYYCDNYYRRRDGDRLLSEEKLKFDKVLKK